MGSKKDYGEIGDSKFEKEDYNGAIQDYQKHLRKNPDSSYYWNQLGRCYHNRNDEAKAIAAYEQSNNVQRNSVFICNKGYVFQGLGAYDLALSECNRSLSMNPEHMPALLLKTRLLLKMGKPSEAVETYRSYIDTRGDVDPEDYIENLSEYINDIESDIDYFFDPSKSHISQNMLIKMYVAVLMDYFSACDLEEFCEHIKSLEWDPVDDYDDNYALLVELYGEMLGNIILKDLPEDGNYLDYLVPITKYRRVIGKNAAIYAIGIVGSKYPEYGLDYSDVYKLLEELEKQYNRKNTGRYMKSVIIESMEKILRVLDDDTIEDDYYWPLNRHKDEYYYIVAQYKSSVESLQYFKKAISINNTVPAYWIGLGETFFSCYEYARAVYCFSRALDCATDCPESLIRWFGILGDKYCEFEMYDHAYDCYGKVSEYTSAYREKIKEIKSKLRYINPVSNKFDYEEEFIIDIDRSVFRVKPRIQNGENYALKYYYTSRDSRYRDDHNKYILKMKGEYLGDFVEYFFNQIKKILNPDANIAVCVVPPSTANKITYMYQLAQRIVQEYQFIDATSCLQRTETVEKSHWSSDRSEQKHLDSIEIFDVEKIRYRNVLLLDDIVTSGNSLAACKKILLENNAKCVECLALGSTYRR